MFEKCCDVICVEVIQCCIEYVIIGIISFMVLMVVGLFLVWKLVCFIILLLNEVVEIIDVIVVGDLMCEL